VENIEFYHQLLKDHEIIFSFIFFYIGSIWGSFINVVVYRLPEGLSIIYPPSFCPVCKRKLKWYNNIPIFSYIFQRGRCSFCGAKIPIRYLFIELFTGFYTLVGFILYIKLPDYQFGLWEFLSFLTIGYTGIIISYIDFKYKLIPLQVLLVGSIIQIILLFIGLKFYIWILSPIILDALLGAFLGFFILWIVRLLGNRFFKKEAMGEGDLYLLGYLGLFGGIFSITFILLYSSFLAIIFGLLYMKYKGDKEIPYGPFLVGGFFIHYFMALTGTYYAFLFN